MELVTKNPKAAPIVIVSPIEKVLTKEELEKIADKKSERINDLQFYGFMLLCVGLVLLFAYFKNH